MESLSKEMSDNDGEFTSNLMKVFYTKTGILIGTPCPRTPPSKRDGGKKT